MSYWRVEYDDGWWTFYKDGIEIKFDNPNFGDLIVDEINNANQRIAELEEKLTIKTLENLKGASVLTDLKARIAELEAQQRWILVEERLPDNWKFVLTIDISQSTRVPVTAFYNPETSLWETDFSCGLWVTHWMPLPEQPIVYGKVCEE